ncbi:MAG: hypothetical protein CME71_07255 [Halobacteriovorax sp.]|nr:hypothetical protein [Halobacteriovorax sp.]|tara:strand:- start:506 stop:736 length:231 start_codon:yes stop_codon:yes gene_type:complete
MSGAINKKQGGQAVIEYIFILAFVMVILVSFISEFSQVITRRVQSLNYAVTHFLTTGSCPNACLLSNSSFKNDLGE